MTRVDRPTVLTYIALVSMDLFDLLALIVAVFAKGLQGTKEERVLITVVWMDVVSDGGWFWDALG
jgi:hypothetical protein